VVVGIVAAAISALAYGIASALQAVAARAEPTADGVDARLLARLARNATFATGLALDVVGFVGQFVALRFLAVFVVQAVQAGNLAVTAVAAVPLLKVRLRAREWAAIASVCVGLVLLSAAAGHEGVEPVRIAVKWSLLAAAGVVTLLGFLAGRLRGRVVAPALGFLAGVGFGVVALSARVLTDLAVVPLLRNPATYAMLIGGVISFLFFTTALQRGAVTAVTASVIVAETILPAAVGVIVLGDGTRPGLVWLAATGFGLAIAGALTLARFGDLAPAEAHGVAATGAPTASAMSPARPL
jgi:drug/metabolite transporter (DMT)-like permease